jgi:hypothetical protein
MKKISKVIDNLGFDMNLLHIPYVIVCGEAIRFTNVAIDNQYAMNDGIYVVYTPQFEIKYLHLSTKFDPDGGEVTYKAQLLTSVDHIKNYLYYEMSRADAYDAMFRYMLSQSDEDILFDPTTEGNRHALGSGVM